MNSELNTPTPDAFLNAIGGYQRTAAVKAAIELDIFTVIAQGTARVSEISTACGASEPGTRVLCDYLTINGLLKKHDSNYSLTSESRLHLDRNSPAYLGGTLEFLLSSMITGCFEDLAAVVREGGTVTSELGTIAPDHPVWVKFARAMMGFQALPAQRAAELIPVESPRPLRILDVAAGHGLLGIALARRHEQATVTALD